MEFKEIIERNYNATVKRGKITSETTVKDFISKIIEENKELIESRLTHNIFDEKELSDIILVCTTMAKHYNIDIQKVLEEKTLYNETRND